MSSANVRGACAIIRGLPPRAFCGIDLLSFTTSPKFLGIRNIPKGWHFIFCSPSDSFSIRHGAWCHIENDEGEKADTLVLNWANDTEQLHVVDDETTVRSERDHFRDSWNDSLTLYRQTVSSNDGDEDNAKKIKEWSKLTGCITKSVMSRILGPRTNQWTLTSAANAKQDADEIPGLSSDRARLVVEKELGFLPIDLKRTWREGAIGRERTLAAQDRTWALQDLVQRYCTDSLEVIGELQFTFPMVLTLNNYSCLEQWKRLLGLLFSCKLALTESPDFFCKILQTLRMQLEHGADAEGGLLDFSDDEGNLLKSLIKTMRQNLADASGFAKSDIMDELEELEQFLQSKHGWALHDIYVRQGRVQLEDGEEAEVTATGSDDETGDYAPVLVDLTPEQARHLNIDRAVDDPARGAQERTVLRSGRGYEMDGRDFGDDEERNIEDADERY